MRRYVRISGLFFSLLAVVQLVRVIMRWPVVVNGVNVPIWASAIAVVVAGSFAVWAFRTSSAAAS
jgi:hypothetical protein